MQFLSSVLKIIMKFIEYSLHGDGKTQPLKLVRNHLHSIHANHFPFRSNQWPARVTGIDFRISLNILSPVV